MKTVIATKIMLGIISQIAIKSFQFLQTLPLTILLTAVLLAGCQSTAQKDKASHFIDQEVKQTVTAYLTTFALHEDFTKLLSFYSPNAELTNIIKGDKAKGLKAIETYYNWNDPKLTLNRSQAAFVQEKILIDGLHAVIVGYLMPFEYDGVNLGPWRTMILLEFNEQLKIIKQTDFINYTPKSIFLSSPNTNKDIRIPTYLLKNKR